MERGRKMGCEYLEHFYIIKIYYAHYFKDSGHAFVFYSLTSSLHCFLEEKCGC